MTGINTRALDREQQRGLADTSLTG
jgi:hypothetical protein